MQLYVDTLTYNPQTKEITYGKSDVFKYVSGLRPFVGEWKKVDNEGASEYVKLSLYQEIKAPEEYPLNGSALLRVYYL